MSKQLLLAGVLAGALAAAGSAGAVELVTNGGFANGATPPPGGFSTIAGGQVPGWTVLSGNVDWITGLWQSSDGDGYSIDLNGGTPGSIGQTISTVFGQQYRISFDISGNPDSFYGQTRVAIVGANGTIGSANYVVDSNSRSDMQWEGRTLTFVADSASTLITFTSGTGGSNCCWGAAIDNVSVGVPEPTTWALMIAGFGGVGAMLRRRREALA